MHRIRHLLFLMFAFFVTGATVFAAPVYKSFDKAGKVVYSDLPPDHGKVEKTLSFQHVPSNFAPGSIAGVQLFTATWCAYCKKAKSYLSAHNIQYQEFDIETPGGKEAFKAASAQRAVPLLLWKEKQVRGFSKSQYDAFFNAKQN